VESPTDLKTDLKTEWKIDHASRWELRTAEAGKKIDPVSSTTAEFAAVPAPLRETLEKELRAAIQGEVRFDDGSRALYATDGSNYRQVPIGVVIPKDIEDVVRTFAVCRKHGTPVLSRGGGTSLAGQCCNVAVVIDYSKNVNAVLSVDPERKRAVIQPGLVLDHLRNPTKEKYGLTFGPDPATHDHCTLGGMMGNNSCGVHALMSGRTSDNILELEVLTYDGLRLRVGPTSEEELARIIREGGRRGEIYARMKGLRDRYATLIRERFPKIPRRVSGYNLDELLPENGFNVARALIGTEGTCVAILEATLHLIDWPKYQSLLILGYPDIYAAADHVPLIRKFGPIGLEGIDRQLVKYSIEKGLAQGGAKELPKGDGWLIVEFGGDTQEAADLNLKKAAAALAKLPDGPTVKWMDDPELVQEIWELRESGLGATARIARPGKPALDAFPGWEDAAVPPGKEGEYLRAFKKLLAKYGYEASLYGHFGQGCIHTRIPFDLFTADGVQQYRHFVEEAADLVVKFGGSLSGEHGDGQARAELLPKMYGPELVEAFREFKSIWDPQGKMNPGKVVDPAPLDSHLRLGPSYHPPELNTVFKYPDDNGSLPYATLRCVGVGKCRRTEGGTMCPSYQATHEERDSTRGRAHLLHEALTGDFLRDGWQSEAVKESLDLCLSCKGCKKDCPVNVDVATYKAEFLSHYYAHRTRPRSAYAMGLIDRWAHLASHAPGLANFASHAPGLGRLAKGVAGLAPERELPKFSRRTFKDWFFAREKRESGVRREVFLWADTFTNYFEPWIAASAVEVLEKAGFRVTVERSHLCCGRPLYDYGMLDDAQAYLKAILRRLQPVIESGIPVVALEPSCAAVFKDEMLSLFPTDRDAKRLSAQVKIFSDFILENAREFTLEREFGKAVVQLHCHQKAVLDAKCPDGLLGQLGIATEILETGCCGLAGSFGFEKEAGRYEVSMAIGEHGIFPKVRAEPDSTLVVADGFSCRHQISHGTERQALHIAEVIHRATFAEPYDEKRWNRLASERN
jgi:FAD/FMN-containing dehydrogenase/Fe-S oxidoreductase